MERVVHMKGKRFRDKQSLIYDCVNYLKHNSLEFQIKLFKEARVLSGQTAVRQHPDQLPKK
jgi:hypothetical protein